jgi:hypothetical protein
MLFASFFKACEAAPHDCQITTLDFAGRERLTAEWWYSALAT